MTESVQEAPVAGRAPDGRRAPVGLLILASAVCLLLQVAGTDYGMGARDRDAAVFWFAVGAALLALVYYKRSSIACNVAAATAVIGTVIYVVASLSGGSFILALLYFGQALPLLTPPVRQHVSR